MKLYCKAQATQQDVGDTADGGHSDMGGFYHCLSKFWAMSAAWLLKTGRVN